MTCALKRRKVRNPSFSRRTVYRIMHQRQNIDTYSLIEY